MNILLVDDHPLFRGGMRFLLSSLDVEVALDEAGDCPQAIALASTKRYDVLLLDLKLPGVRGMDALAALREAFPSTPIVVMSGEDHPRVVREAIEAGAMGFIPKSSTPEVMVQALRLVLASGIYIPSEVLIAASREDAAPEEAVPVPEPSVINSLKGLSPRQMEVLRCVIQGKPNKVIARELDIADATVKAHLSSVLRALNVRNRTEAVYAAAKLGLRLV
jgi:DNA-binding NarL/FixJ family response regulator